MMIAVPVAASAVILPVAPAVAQLNEGVGDENGDSGLGDDDGSILSHDDEGVLQDSELAVSSGVRPDATLAKKLENIIFPSGVTESTVLNIVLSVAAIGVAWVLVHAMSELSSRAQLGRRKVR